MKNIKKLLVFLSIALLLSQQTFSSSPTPPTPPTPPTIIGTAGSYNNKGNIAAKAFDSNLATFFDAPTPGTAAVPNWVGISYPSKVTITGLQYAPRPGFESRMIGGYFEYSSVSNFNPAIKIATITATPKSGILTTILSNATFSFIRYVSPAGSFGNIAEFKILIASAATTGLAANPSDEVSSSWTKFAGNGHIWYVDSNNGNDSNAGTITVPVKDINHLPLKAGDSVLFKSGQQQGNIGTINTSGILISSYGPSAAVFNLTNAADGMRINASNVLVQNLSISGDSNSTKGIEIVGDNNRVEGCQLCNHWQAIQAGGNSNTIFRCNISHNHVTASSGHSAGAYAINAPNLSFDSCVFNANGWLLGNPATADIFQHAIYENDGVPPVFSTFTCINCIFANSGSNGILGRPGGICNDCLFIDNGLDRDQNAGGCSAIMGGPQSSITNCVVTSAIDAQCPTITRGGTLSLSAQNGVCNNNIIVHSVRGAGPAISLGVVSSNGLNLLAGNAQIQGNWIEDWNGWGIDIQTQRSTLAITGNSISVPTTQRSINYRVPTTQLSVGNSYGQSPIFGIFTATSTLAQWTKQTNEPILGAVTPKFTGITLEAYATGLGINGINTDKGLLSAAESNCNYTGNWSANLTADAINNYFRSALSK